MPDVNTMTHKRRKPRFILLALVFLLIAGPVSAQGTARILAPGSTLSDALSPDATATSFVFDSPENRAADIIVESGAESSLAILLSDVNGNVLARAAESSEGGLAAIDNAQLTSGGRYFVLVYFAPESSVAQTDFSITLALDDAGGGAAEVTEGEAEAIGEASQVLLAGGIDVRLSWTGAADMNLQVRDPSGETLYWESRTTNNGGSFGGNANGWCDLLSPLPAEEAKWQPGFLPVGSYELLIFYREACDGSVGSVPFTVDVAVDNESVGTISDVLSQPSQGQDSVYIARFEIDGAGGAVLSDGGVYPDASLNRLPAGFDISSVISASIALNTPVVGAISNESPYTTYAFNGSANDVITVSMEAVGANLDSLLQIVDGSGAILRVNDDADGSTNSRVSDLRLPSSGAYTIIATRYGKELGGTEGQFQLTLSAVASEPEALTARVLPAGDIAVTLVWDTEADLQLLVRDPVGESVFDDNPFINSGGILQEAGNVNCVPAASGAPLSYIYWPPGRARPGSYEVEVWYQSACSDVARPVEFELDIAVAGSSIARERKLTLANQRFVTHFTVEPDGSARAGLGGFIDGGSAIIVYQSEALEAPIIIAGQSVSGAVTRENTFDVYSFQGAAGQTATIRMTAETQALDASLFLISPSGIEIAENDDADPILRGDSGFPKDAIIGGQILAENGPYTIIATRYAAQHGGTVGNYTLTLELDG